MNALAYYLPSSLSRSIDWQEKIITALLLMLFMKKPNYTDNQFKTAIEDSTIQAFIFGSINKKISIT
jgi:hypothetical protein